MGYRRQGKLRYTGKVGTGFDDDSLRTPRRRLGQRERTTPPFAGAKLPTEGVHWGRPDLVVEVAFTEWTGEEGRAMPATSACAPTRVTKEEPA